MVIVMLPYTMRAKMTFSMTSDLVDVQVGACPGALEVAGPGVLWHVHRLHPGPCPLASPHRGAAPLLSMIQVTDESVH